MNKMKGGYFVSRAFLLAPPIAEQNPKVANRSNRSTTTMESSSKTPF